MRRALLIITLLALLVGTAQAQTVRLMGYGGSDPAIVQRLLDEVIGAQLAAEGITVQYEPIETDYNQVLVNALSAGTAADVFYIPGETAPGIIATGKVLPITNLVDTSAFIGSLMDVYTVGGEIYGIPKDFNTLAVFYNEDLFDEAGVEYPNENDDWNTFADKLRAVAALGDDVNGVCLAPSFDRYGAFAYGNGWAPFTADGGVDLSDPAFVEAFDYFTGLVTEGTAVQPSNIGAGWPGDCLAQERAGVAIEGAWIIGFLRDAAPNLPYGSTLLPKSPTTGERGNFIYTVAWGVNSDSPNRDAAVRVLEALTSAETQQFILEQGLAIPSREALADNPFFQEDSREARGNLTVFRGASDGHVLGFQFGTVGTDYMAPLNNAAADVMTGQGTSAAVLARAQQDIDALLERARR